MVNIKGFTLIELMVVVAILGILLSLAIGPARNMHNSASAGVDNASDDDSIVIINGIPHTCDEFGNCERAD